MEFNIIGFGRTGQAIAEQLIRLSYFDKNKEIRINAFSDESTRKNAFEEKFPVVKETPDHYSAEDTIRIQKLKQHINFPIFSFNTCTYENSQFTSGNLFLSAQEKDLTRIGIVCLQDAPRNLALGDSLIQQFRAPFDKVYVRSDDPASEIRNHITESIAEKNKIKLDNKLEAFPPLNEICNIEAIGDTATEKLAQIIHNEYFEALKKSDPNVQQASADKWENIPEIYKVSNILAAAHTEIKCSLLGIPSLDLDEAENLEEIAQEVRKALRKTEDKQKLEGLSECEHNRWCAEKLLDNWIPGIKRSETEKRHQNLVPWNLEELVTEAFSGFKELDEKDKKKDRDTIRNIPENLEAVAKQLQSTTQ